VPAEVPFDEHRRLGLGIRCGGAMVLQGGGDRRAQIVGRDLHERFLGP
jgi:hypothetical protein